LKTVISIFGLCPKYKVKDNSIINSDSSFDDSSIKSLSLSDIDVEDINYRNGFSSESDIFEWKFGWRKTVVD